MEHSLLLETLLAELELLLPELSDELELELDKDWELDDVD